MQTESSEEEGKMPCVFILIKHTVKQFTLTNTIETCTQTRGGFQSY